MRKFFVLAIPIVTLALFIVIMLRGNYVKRPFGTDDNIPDTIEEIMKNVMDENWDKVEAGTNNLESAWKNSVIYLLFNFIYSVKMHIKGC